MRRPVSIVFVMMFILDCLFPTEGDAARRKRACLFGSLTLTGKNDSDGVKRSINLAYQFFKKCVEHKMDGVLNLSLR